MSIFYSFVLLFSQRTNLPDWNEPAAVLRNNCSVTFVTCVQNTSIFCSVGVLNSMLKF